MTLADKIIAGVVLIAGSALMIHHYTIFGG